MEKKARGGTLGAALLITGCCIGAGMIGLPVVSSLAGFIPTTCAMLLCYLFATGTGLLLVEATLWFEKEVNLISMTEYALGKVGKTITWIFFLFLFYCLFVAYIDGGGQLFSNLFSVLFSTPVPRAIGILACILVVGAVVYAGTQMVSYVSRLFLIGLTCSFFALISLGLPSVQKEQLLYANWKATLGTLPILLVCFGYQNLIPTLTYYVKRNVRVLRKAIFIGNLIPFIIYTLWNFVILGLLPEGEPGFEHIASKSQMVTGLLERASQSQSVLLLANIFSFFAILTPFMASAMAFVHFLKDGLKVENAKYDPFIYGLVLIPPACLTFFVPHLFLQALSFAGGFADVVLFGIMPATIIWIGRYVKKKQGPYQVAGGKLFLMAILLFSVGVLLLRPLLS